MRFREMLSFVLLGAVFVCLSEGHQTVKFAARGKVPLYGLPARSYSTVITHREIATWDRALETCQRGQSSLLCYSQARHVSQISAELTFFGFPRMWIRNRNCSSPVLEPNLSVHLNDLNFTRQNGNYVSRHKFITQTDNTKLPFICFANVSAQEVDYKASSRESSAMWPNPELQGEKLYQINEDQDIYFALDNVTVWDDVDGECNLNNGSLACVDGPDFKKRIYPAVKRIRNDDGKANVWYSGAECDKPSIPFSALLFAGLNDNSTFVTTEITGIHKEKYHPLCQHKEIAGTTSSTKVTVNTGDISTTTEGKLSSSLSTEPGETLSSLSTEPESTLTSESTDFSSMGSTEVSGGSTTGPIKCCPGKTIRGLTWTTHCQSGFVEVPCPEETASENSKARWHCNAEKGEWTTNTPDLGECTSTAINDILSKVNSSNIPEALELLQKEPPLYGGDMLAIGSKLTEVLHNLQSVILSMEQKERKNFTASLADEVANLGNSLFQKKDIWSDLPQDRRTIAATNLLKDEEKAAFEYAYNLEDEHVKSIKKTVLAIQMMKDTFGEYRDKSLVLPRRSEGNWLEDAPTFVLPEGFEKSFANDGKNTFVVFVNYVNLESILVKSSNVKTGNITSSSTLNSPVVCVSVNKIDQRTKLDNKIQYVVRHSDTRAERPVCAFWNTRSFTWDTEGCEYVSHTSTSTVCACDHLTSFAVLMDIHGVLDTLTEADQHALKIITQVGCVISIIFLTAAIAVTIIYRTLWSIRNSVHRNLCISLLLAEIIFISGGSGTSNKVLCAVIAGFLHYFFLAAFCWMFLEAVVIYFLLYKVFSPKKSYTKRFYLFGYGLPMLIVAISASARPSGYGTSTFCWLSLENNLRWSFVGPAALVLSVNFVALVYALRVAVRTNKNINPKTGHPVSRTWILGAITLIPLLGCTWILGFLLMRNEPAVVYTFTVLNSLQGLAIFVVQCLLNQSSRKCLMKSFGKYTNLIPVGSLSSSTLRSTVQGDIRRRSTNPTIVKGTTDSTSQQPTGLPAHSNHDLDQTEPDGRISQKIKSRSFGSLFFRTISSQSRSVDLSTVSYSNSSEVCYLTNEDDDRSVVLRQHAQRNETFT